MEIKEFNEKGLVLFFIGVTAFFGAGMVDMITDVVPLRPYSGLFITGLALRKRHSGKSPYINPNRRTDILEQINEPLELYAKKKVEAFNRRKKLA